MAKEQTIKSWLEKRGHMVRKNHGGMFSVAGEPDLDVWLRFGPWQPWAIPIRIEVKRDRKDRPKTTQCLRMSYSEMHGVSCYVVWETDQLTPILNYWRGVAERFFKRD